MQFILLFNVHNFHLSGISTALIFAFLPGHFSLNLHFIPVKWLSLRRPVRLLAIICIFSFFFFFFFFLFFYDQNGFILQSLRPRSLVPGMVEHEMSKCDKVWYISSVNGFSDYFPPTKGGGHIVFGADPICVRVGVRVASFRHEIF